MKQQQRVQYGLIGISLLVIVGLLCVGGIGVGWMIARTGPLSDAGLAQGSSQAPAPPTATPLAVRSSANDLETQIEAVYERAGPAVVNITSRSLEYDFFLRPTPREGTGSGFFYDSEGHIVTNYHVIQDAEELHVSLSDGRSLPARVVGSDPSNDLAVIKVTMSPDQVRMLSVREADDLRVGQFVVAIGNPFGLERTLTMGVVSSLGRVIESPNQRFIGEIIQTDAPINPGNSGGPLLNLAGEVVGVNSAIFSPSGTSAGIGFAIPARTVRRVVPALIESGHYPHPTLGVQVFELTSEWAELLRRAGMDVPVERGLLVVRAAQDSELRSGTERVRVGHLLVPIGGDIIIAVDETKMETARDLIVYLETQTEVGQTVQVQVIRDGREQTVTVRLRELTQ